MVENSRKYHDRHITVEANDATPTVAELEDWFELPAFEREAELILA